MTDTQKQRQSPSLQTVLRRIQVCPACGMPMFHNSWSRGGNVPSALCHQGYCMTISAREFPSGENSNWCILQMQLMSIFYSLHLISNLKPGNTNIWGKIPLTNHHTFNTITLNSARSYDKKTYHVRLSSELQYIKILKTFYPAKFQSKPLSLVVVYRGYIFMTNCI